MESGNDPRVDPCAPADEHSGGYSNLGAKSYSASRSAASTRGTPTSALTADRAARAIGLNACPVASSMKRNAANELKFSWCAEAYLPNPCNASFTSAANSSSVVSSAKRFASLGVVVHTTFERVPSPMGNNAIGPVGKNRCHAVAFGRSVRTVPTTARWPYPHPPIFIPALCLVALFGPSAATMSLVSISMVSFVPSSPLSPRTVVSIVARALVPGASSSGVSCARAVAPRTRRTPNASIFPSNASNTTEFSTTCPKFALPSSPASYETCPPPTPSHACIRENAPARPVASIADHAPPHRCSKNARDRGVNATHRASAPSTGARASIAFPSTTVTERFPVTGFARNAHANAAPATPPPTTTTSARSVVSARVPIARTALASGVPIVRIDSRARTNDVDDDEDARARRRRRLARAVVDASSSASSFLALDVRDGASGETRRGGTRA